jgi:multidrug resistance efflux pump
LLHKLQRRPQSVSFHFLAICEVGQNVISVVADSYWVDAYFEETQLASIRDGDSVKIKWMGNTQIITGEAVDIARGINVSNAQPNQQGLAMVNPIFTWVRLAQRVPVRIRCLTAYTWSLA